jgi:hypothetical protein
MKAKALSATMVACIDMAREAGGELVRYQGGFWAPRGAHPLAQDPAKFGSGRGLPTYHSTPTVHAIVTRGFAKYSEHREGRHSTFPIAIRLND